MVSDEMRLPVRLPLKSLVGRKSVGIPLPRLGLFLLCSGTFEQLFAVPVTLSNF